MNKQFDGFLVELNLTYFFLNAPFWHPLKTEKPLKGHKYFKLQVFLSMCDLLMGFLVFLGRSKENAGKKWVKKQKMTFQLFR